MLLAELFTNTEQKTSYKMSPVVINLANLIIIALCTAFPMILELNCITLGYNN